MDTGKDDEAIVIYLEEEEKYKKENPIRSRKPCRKRLGVPEEKRLPSHWL